MDTVIFLLIVIVAGCFLYIRMKGKRGCKLGESSCGCSDCGGGSRSDGGLGNICRDDLTGDVQDDFDHNK